MKKKLFSILLSIAMVVTMMPAMSMSAFADSSDKTTSIKYNGQDTGLYLVGSKEAITGNDYVVYEDEDDSSYLTINVKTSGWKLTGVLNGNFSDNTMSIDYDSIDNITLSDLDLTNAKDSFLSAYGSKDGQVTFSGKSVKLHRFQIGADKLLVSGSAQVSIAEGEFRAEDGSLTIENANIDAHTSRMVALSLLATENIEIKNSNIKAISTGDDSFGLQVLNGKLIVDKDSEVLASGKDHAVVSYTTTDLHVTPPGDVSQVKEWKASSEFMENANKSKLTGTCSFSTTTLWDSFTAECSMMDSSTPARTVYKAAPQKSGWSLLAKAMAGEGTYSAEKTVTDGADTPANLFKVKDANGTRTIKLLSDLTAGESDSALVVPEGKKVDLDLNGHVLNRGLVAADGTVTANDHGSVIEVVESATLTVKDSNSSAVHKFKKIQMGNYESIGVSGFDKAYFNLDRWIWDESNGEEIVKGGIITGGSGSATDTSKLYIGDVNNGCGIISDGNLNIYGGNIIGNIADDGSLQRGGTGGGITALKGSLNINGGTIRNNYNYAGGGIGIICDAVQASISGGAIFDNRAYVYGAGIVTSGSLIMNGGTISNNITTRYGGGVTVQGGNFTMNKGKISDNQVIGSGGNCHGCGVSITGGWSLKGNVAVEGKFVMNGGEISGNKGFSGAGVGSGRFQGKGGIFEMNGGKICNNKAIYVGGGLTSSVGPSTINGGEIIGNEAPQGGGIAAWSSVTITGGRICDNTATANEGVTNAKGGGLYILHPNDQYGGITTIGGNANITGNVIGGTIKNGVLIGGIPNNIYHEDETTIKIGECKNGMCVGVSPREKLASGQTQQFTSDDAADYSKYFYSDDSAYYVNFNTDHLELKAPASGNHAINVIPCEKGNITASVKEAAKGEAVTLKVSANSGCELKSLKYNDQKVTKNAKGQYQFQMPNKDVTIKAEFGFKKNPVELLTAKASGKKAVKLSWTKLTGATKYVVYGNKSGKKLKKLKTIKANKKASYTVKKIKGSKLKAYKPYKFYVVAYKGSKKLATSKKITFVTGNKMGKYANVKTIKAKKSKVTLAKGKKITVGATYKMYYGKKHLKKSYGPKLTYASNCKAVATVSSKGKVTAKAPGTATIYIMDLSGKYCKTTVTVK